jgi:hypothetical protein
VEREKQVRPHFDADGNDEKKRKFRVHNPLMQGSALQVNEKYGACNEQVKREPNNTKDKRILDSKPDFVF